MAMSRSLMECGNDEVRDDGVTDICSFCATGGKLQPALHFCFDCGVYGRYICGICLRNHNMFLNNHEVERIANQSTSKRIKGNDSKVRELQQSNEALQKDKAKLLNENAEMRHTIQSIKKENDTLAKTLDETSKEADKELKSKMEDFEHESKNNENRFLDLKKERNDLLSRLEENDDRIKALVISNGNLQKDKNSLEEEKAELMRTIRDIKKENETLSKELHDFEVKHIGHAIAKDSHRQELGLKIRKKDKRKSCVGLSVPTVKSTFPMIAIEIGYSKSALGFLFGSYQTMRDIITFTSWPSYISSMSTPTVALFDANKIFHSFGYEAEEKYAELEIDGEHQEWYLFRRFMLKLQEEQVDINYYMIDVKGKVMKAIDVLSAVIAYLKDLSLTSIKKGLKIYEANAIQWIIPTPAIWTDTANQIMREAAYQAGINDTDLTLVSAPEAACYQREYSESTETAVQAMSNPGTKIMVIDLGDCTFDFTILERESNGCLQEMKAAAASVPCDTNIVVMEILRLIRNILGNEIYQQCIDENPYEYVDLQRKAEAKVRTFRPSNEGKMTMPVPVSFKETFKKVHKQTINEGITKMKFNGQIKWIGDKMRLNSELAKSMFQPCIDRVIGYIEDLLKEQDVRDTGVFLMVGALSECLMVQEAIKEAFPNVRVIIPAVPSTAVMKGSLIYGSQ